MNYSNVLDYLQFHVELMEWIFRWIGRYSLHLIFAQIFGIQVLQPLLDIFW
jgi:hypothetical protein